jgi:hypothetical protein
MKKGIVFLATIALLVAYAMPVSAENTWGFYGSARMFTDYAFEDAGTAGVEDDQTSWFMPSNARIGARVKGDVFNARFEYGTSVNLRLLYATWNFGPATLKIGQDYGPVNIFLSNQIAYDGNFDANILNIGGVYGGRNPMLALSFGPVEVGLLAPNANDISGIAGADVDIMIPKLEVSLYKASGAWWVKAVGGYQTYNVEIGALDYDVDAWVLGLGGGFSMGPFGIKLGGMFSSNPNEYGLWTSTGAGFADRAAATYTAATNTVNDTDAWGLSGVVTFKATDMFNFEGGIGYISADTAPNDDTAMVYYIQCVISPAPGFTITPEIGYFDWMDNQFNVDEGSAGYIAAKWQINF